MRHPEAYEQRPPLLLGQTRRTAERLAFGLCADQAGLSALDQGWAEDTCKKYSRGWLDGRAGFFDGLSDDAAAGLSSDSGVDLTNAKRRRGGDPFDLADQMWRKPRAAETLAA